MLRIALKMLTGDRAKFTGLLFGIAFTSFLVTFAASFFAGFMTRGFALVTENPQADVWVMDPAVNSTEQTTNITDGALSRVRSVAGVRFATPLAVNAAEIRFPNGAFQPFQVIGVDDDTLAGMPPPLEGGRLADLRSPDAVFVASGGTTGKLQTPSRREDQWPQGGPHLDVPTRRLSGGDELELNGHRVAVMGLAAAVPRFPPRPMLYTTITNASRILPQEQHLLTFVLVSVAPGESPERVAARIQAQTGLKARTAAEFKADTVKWYLLNSEDVGDVSAMLMMAVTVGFGVTGVMLFMFTSENLRQYAVLKAMGATPRTLISMVFAQAGIAAVLAAGIGLGICGVAGELAIRYYGFPFRMMWFAPLAGVVMVVLISVVAGAISLYPLLRLDPATVFSGR